MRHNFNPQSFRKLDGWLLKHWPLVWRTRIHWVLLFSLMGYLFFGIGMKLFSVSMTDMTSSVKLFHQIFFGFVVISIFVWGYFTVKVPIKSYRLRDFLLTAFLYLIGIWIIGSTNWVANKVYYQKIASLVEEETLKKDHKSFLDAPPLKYEEFLLKTYQVIPTHFDFAIYKDENELETDLRQLYGKPLTSLMKEASDRREFISLAKANANLYFVGVDPGIDYVFSDLFLRIVLLMMIVPLLFVFWSISSFKEILIAGFALFISIVGVGLNSRPYDLVEHYLYFAIPVALLISFIRINHSKINWLTIYGSALMVLIFVADMDILELTGFSRTVGFHFYAYNEFYYPLITAVIAGFGAYLYRRKLKTPQTN